MFNKLTFIMSYVTIGVMLFMGCFLIYFLISVKAWIFVALLVIAFSTYAGAFYFRRKRKVKEMERLIEAEKNSEEEE